MTNPSNQLPKIPPSSRPQTPTGPYLGQDGRPLPKFPPRSSSLPQVNKPLPPGGKNKPLPPLPARALPTPAKGILKAPNGRGAPVPRDEIPRAPNPTPQEHPPFPPSTPRPANRGPVTRGGGGGPLPPIAEGPEDNESESLGVKR